jgi:hypothetical protein
MKPKESGRKAGTISAVRAKAILDDALPNLNRGQDYRAGTRCADPDLLAFQDAHPLAILSGMTCDHFTWRPNDAPSDGRGYVDPLARMAWIGGCYRSPRFNDRTPRALIASTLRDVWSSMRAEVFAGLGSPKTCQAPDCDADLSIGYEVDHVAPQHAEMANDLLLSLGPDAEADWWGYRWRHGENNRLRDHLTEHPDRPLDRFADLIRAGAYQALCGPCHKATTKARKAAKSTKAAPDGAE